MTNTLRNTTQEIPESRTRSARRLLLPGVILLILGVGNLSVGSYKEAEYQQKLELQASASEPSPELEKLAPVARLELIKDDILKEKLIRQHQARSKAVQRKQFYQLVGYGGKLFIGLSATLLSVSLLLKVIDIWR